MPSVKQTSPAVVLAEYGGPEVLKLRHVEVPEPGPGEVLLRHTAIAVNFHDCYVRSGLYRTLTPPGIPGLEAVGVVESLGPGVSHLKPGDRIGWISPLYGGYASHRILPADLAIKLPGTLGDSEAAASLMKALTVHMLVRTSHAIEPGQKVLVHAAAGGVGQLLTRWARHLGATVIGTVGSAQKGEIASNAGAHHLIFYRAEDFVGRTLALTGAVGVDVVYDSIGADTFRGSLQCLDFGGTLVNFGQTSGPVAPFSPADLAVKSLKVTRPIIFHYLRTRDQVEARTVRVFQAFAEGILRPLQPLELDLKDAAEAHRIMEAGRSPGGIVLIP